MDRKAKMGISALMIVAIVFLIIGGCFLPLAIGLLVFSFNVDTGLLVIPIVFGSVGTVFFVLGIVFLSIEMKKRKRCKQLLQDGYYIWAEIVEINVNYNINYGGTYRGTGNHPYIIKCGYTDENGTMHIFRSRNIRNYPGNNLIGQQVRVYVDRNDYHNFKYYYVDVDEVLGNVIEH